MGNPAIYKDGGWRVPRRVACHGSQSDVNPGQLISNGNCTILVICRSRVAGNRGIALHVPLLAQGANRALQEQRTASAPRPMFSAPVYVLGLDAIAAGGDLSAAKLGLWTHVFPSTRDNQIVAADVDADTSRFASLNEGPQVLAFYRQVQSLRQSPDVGPGSFEAGQLRIPPFERICVRNCSLCSRTKRREKFRDPNNVPLA
jgi:hypothetical protein